LRDLGLLSAKTRHSDDRNARPKAVLSPRRGTAVVIRPLIRDHSGRVRGTQHGRRRLKTLSGASQAVFLSYASQDAEAAGRICGRLRAAGIEVWFDQSELRGGDTWDRQIHERIHDCRLFVAIISAHTEARDEGYFRREWKLAVDRTHDMAEHKAFIVPVAVDDTPERRAAVPDKFRHVQWTRLPGGEATPAFIARIAALLDPRPVTGANTNAASTTAPSDMAVAAAQLRNTTVVWVAVFVVAVSCFAAYALWSKLHTHADQQAAVVAPAATPAAPTIPEKSIAVLPFVDMSEKKDQEYFSDGLSEELIDMLTRVPELRVPARTSSFYFKGKQTTIKDIAAALGVAHVLEGSVRKSGNTLRITAQLIRVDDGYHLWSRTFDRRLDDIFKVQDEIAGAVVNALKVSLLQGAPKRTASARNAGAYAAYLQSRFFDYRGGNGDRQRALDNVHEALRLDPTFAPAWAQLSGIIIGVWAAGALPFKQAHEDAQRAAEKAAALDPKLPEAYVALGTISFWMDWNWSAADAAFSRALDLDPDNGDALSSRAALLATLGRLDEALQLAKRMIAKDALNYTFQAALAGYYYSMGRFSEAESAGRIALNLNPVGISRSSLAMVLVLEGKPAAALAEMQHVLPGSTPWEPRNIELAMIYRALGRQGDSDAAMAAAEKNSAYDAGYVAVAHAYRGEVDQAFEWLDRGFRQRYWGMLWIKRQPLLKNIEGDPRFKALLRKMNLPE
jgi:TolB-like protein/Flp pilus assembly protein TadD